MATSNKKKLYYNKVVKRYQEGKSYAVISKELSLGVKTHLLQSAIMYFCLQELKLSAMSKSVIMS